MIGHSSLTSRRHLVTHETKVFSDLRDSKTSWNFFRDCQYSCTFWYYKVAQFHSATMAMGHKTSAAICTSSKSHKSHIGHTLVGSWTIKKAFAGAILARTTLAMLSRAVLARTVHTRRAVLPKAKLLAIRTMHGSGTVLTLEWYVSATIHNCKHHWSHHHLLQALGVASGTVFFALTKSNNNLSWEDLVPVPVVSACNTKRPNKASATDTLWSYFQNAQHRV
mmetsp:Transcript_22688/g.34196  ORF Transcript_22688/g.34196 Transcript_22688/m.34196 type:complete len:222 (+) Transcript_22688:157-822(+)